jgi:glycosyltransferase involved in cell wall biosynthesis
MALADRATFAAPGSRQMYADRYPQSAEKLRVIENGYDADLFAGIDVVGHRRAPDRPVTLLHSGLIYPSERDPTAFFDALSELKRAGRIDGNRIRVVLRACGSADLFGKLARERNIDDIVSFPPASPYREALAEMMSTDVLLVLQATNCNHLIPAKIYECFRARRPVVALTDPAGDTAAKLEAAGINTIAPLDDAAAIARLIERVLRDAHSDTLPTASEEAIDAADRRSRARELAALLDEVTARRGAIATPA